MPPTQRSPRIFFPLLGVSIAAAASALLLAPVTDPPPLGEKRMAGTPAHIGREVAATLRAVASFGSAVDSAPVSDTHGGLWVTVQSQLQHVGMPGSPRKVRDLPTEPLAGVALSGGWVWTVSREGQIHAWDGNGASSTRTAIRGPVVTPPQADHRGGLYVAGGNHLYRVSRSGVVTQQLSTPGRIGGLSTFDEGRGAAVTAHDGSLCLSTAGTKPPRCTVTLARLDAPPTVTEDRVYATGDDGHVLAFDRRSLSPTFHVTLDGHVRSGLTALDDRLLMQTFGPRPALLTLSARDGRTLATVPLPLLDHREQGSRHAPLVVADDLLLTLGPADAALLTDSHGRLLQTLRLKGSDLASAVRSPLGPTFIAAGRSVYALDL